MEQLHVAGAVSSMQRLLMFVNGMVHALTPAMKLWYTNNSPFTSYTTLSHPSQQLPRRYFRLRDVTHSMYKIIATCIERTRANNSVPRYS